jgi:hypothetical protein
VEVRVLFGASSEGPAWRGFVVPGAEVGRDDVAGFATATRRLV